jgi:hypothetical protein
MVTRILHRERSPHELQSTFSAGSKSPIVGSPLPQGNRIRAARAIKVPTVVFPEAYWADVILIFNGVVATARALLTSKRL